MGNIFSLNIKNHFQMWLRVPAAVVAMLLVEVTREALERAEWRDSS
tara:strand:- start:307 stop:444 length:138 start_codon:yes stop_codon:yes gene_type:complete